ncbi:Protein of unknown function [Palleronia marisminoris]|uniref:DUF2783 domain-containing protein n=1 Tax=Palleronia marisminoris TaxID=315423 RepID=A0A1Y5SC56_9RHOB|nr:DUF2783 domain-containing protein [Palleronia marisminoris]SFG66987.1 Protein of unknown function [Palleronia marisminoris]SLN34244.1 hypothetical protein PAM7066_01424 [Palleronia marisminoris]
MTALVTSGNIARPDDVYDLLLSAHDGLTKEESDALNARLILTLFNHVGDIEVIRQAIALARQ